MRTDKFLDYSVNWVSSAIEVKVVWSKVAIEKHQRPLRPNLDQDLYGRITLGLIYFRNCPAVTKVD